MSSNSEKAARAKEIQEKRERADRRNHEERIVWLTAQNPVWGCGTPVAEYERVRMLRESRDAIALLNRMGAA
ncbi:hypothetical protein [Burkholderia pyrrocinia]|uniref:hypothetical protein n=1 Tax=Burkholderia pyrrocinia TaxID=60550 RepID=UPI00158DA1A1|nr:hypothetical protein [Burkholderia pyrrocinia]